MRDFNLEKHLSMLLHVLAWIMYIALIFNGNISRYSFNEFLIHYGLIVGSHLIIFYLNYFYLIPKVLSQMQLLVFLAANFIIISILSLILTSILQPFNFTHLLFRCINITWFLLLSVIIRFSTDLYIKIQKDKERENEQLKTELIFLKAQINPHFLFNALNNLYALALKGSPRTAENILQLSAIMRYMLYETNDEKILLSKEIEVIQTYIALHELKNKTQEGINFSINGKTDAITIPPLLLLPLVENAFKHGTYPITISFNLTEHMFQMQLDNKIRASTQQNIGGVGLQNLRRRLDLLYKGTHQLVLNQTQDYFSVTLTLNLNP